MAGTRQVVDLTYPFEGLSETFAFSDQPPATSRDERNMRCFDPHTGRMRGTQRAGLALLSGQAAANGFNKIADINTVTREINPYNWSVLTTPDVIGQVEFDSENTGGLRNCVDMQRDLFGSYWALAEGGSVIKINSDGQEIEEIKVSVEPFTELYARRICVDDFGNVFVSSGQKPGHALSVNDAAWIRCYELREDGTYALAWTLKPGFHPLDIKVYGADLYVWGVYYDSATPGSTQLRFRRYVEYGFVEEPVVEEQSSYNHTYTDLNYGFGGTGSALASTIDWTTLTHDDPHIVGGMSVRDDGQVYVTAEFCGSNGAGNEPSTYLCHLARLNPISLTAATPVWSKLSLTGGTPAEIGFGTGVNVSPKRAADGRYVFHTYGGSDALAGVATWLDIDTGMPPMTSADVFEDSAGVVSKGFTMVLLGGWSHAHRYGRAHVDPDGCYIVPYHGFDNWSAGNEGARHGVNLLYYLSNAVGAGIRTYTSADFGLGSDPLRCVQTSFAYPDYQGASIDRSHVIYVGADQNVASGNSAFAARLAQPTIDATLPLREMAYVACSGGNWYKFDTSGFTLINDEAGNPFSYETTSNYISSARHKGLIYYADGVDYYQYDPAKNAMSHYRAKTDGGVPERCRLMVMWRGRMVLARSDEAPGAWHMSRNGDVYDWNPFPTTTDTSQPHSGVTSRAGDCPDSINCLIPYSDDTIWFGCDSSIYQMTGDPAGEAVFDLVSDEIGMSFGQPWCKDDVGQLWFFGSKGGLYTIKSDARGRMNVVDVSRGRIRKRLQSLDLTNYYVRLIYNFVDDGIHMLVMPFGNPGYIVDHYFYDKRCQSFHIDTFGAYQSDKIQPTSAHVVDGDSADDRAILIGGEDGRIRRWGKDLNGMVPLVDEAETTVEKRIDSYILMGPIAPVRDDGAAVLGEFTAILAPTYGGCTYEIYSTDNPDKLPQAVWSGQLHSGRNATALPRVSGDSLYIKLANGDNTSWSYEKATAALSYGGTLRKR